MKRMFSLLLGALAIFFSSVSHAQLGSMDIGGNAGLNAALMAIFGSHNAFTAKTDIKVFNNGDKREFLRAPVTMALLDRQMRTDGNVGEMSGSSITPETVGQLKSLGLDRLTFLVRLDLAKIEVLFPNMKSSVDLPLPKNAIPPKANPKMIETPLGKETINRHPCAKSRIIVTGSDQVKRTFTVWKATDLKNFPVKIEIIEDGQRLVMEYSNINLAKPDSKLFTTPGGYKKYQSLEAFQQAVAQKMIFGR